MLTSLVTQGRPQPAVKRLSTAALAAAVRESVTRFNRRLRRERPDSDLTLSQLSALAVLDRRGPISPTELAASERIKPPSMTRILAALEVRGLVVRSPHPSDKRQVIVALSETGAGLVRENRRAREAWLARELAKLTPQQRETLAAAMSILDNLATT